MRAGKGVWHSGGAGDTGLTRGFQLWIALPPHLELGGSESIYQSVEDIPQVGPARLLLGSHEGASSAITAPSPNRARSLPSSLLREPLNSSLKQTQSLSSAHPSRIHTIWRKAITRFTPPSKRYAQARHISRAFARPWSLKGACKKPLKTNHVANNVLVFVGATSVATSVPHRRSLSRLKSLLQARKSDFFPARATEGF
jgi:hypothetical protein